MGLLLYQNFDGISLQYEGNWSKSTNDEWTDKAFFISNDDGSNSFTFTPKNEIDYSKLEWMIDQFKRKESSNIILDENQYQNLLRNFKQAMHSRRIDKAIFSRIDQSVGTFNALKIYEALCHKYKGKAFIYLVADKLFGVWIGATPEILLKGDQSDFSTMALAGTKARKATLWGGKEIEEQELVADFIQLILDKNGAENLIRGKTETVFSGSVYHLSTKFRFQYSIHKIAKLIHELHPTPAVCGLPRSEAMKLIRETEPHQRSFYTGILGWINKKQVQTFVNLRCMELFENSADLYVGGGITNDSVVKDEWIETQIKADTLKSVFS